jgi:hypothetical protein
MKKRNFAVADQEFITTLLIGVVRMIPVAKLNPSRFDKGRNAEGV